MESMIVASFSVAETAPKGAKSCTPQPSRRPSLIRADALASGWRASQPGHFQSLAACAYVDLGHAVGITGATPFLARQFRHPGQARASLPTRRSLADIVWR